MKNRERKRRASGLLRWCAFRLSRLVHGPFRVTRKEAVDKLRRRAYPVGQWHRWYKANRGYQTLTGTSLFRWQVR